jgi:hypothetical protein
LAAGTSLIFSVTSGKVAHPPPRVKTEASRKKKKKDVALFMAIPSREREKLFSRALTKRVIRSVVHYKQPS